jgi:uncharacterized protein (DUF427 family)
MGDHMAGHIKIRKAVGTWVVRAGGAVLAESSNALELAEGDYPAMIYFPRDDIGMAFLERTDSSTNCPHKGQATYYAIHGKSGVIPDAAWSYETPLESVGEIAGHLAFYGDKVTVEQL